MHGTIFAELKKYVDAKVGGDAWAQLLVSAGLGPRLYMALQAYPDEELVKIVTAASKATRQPAAVILEDFGLFIAPDLLGMYRSLVKPEWRSLEVIEHTEDTIHKVVRRQHADATPPYLRASRTGPEQVTVIYDSPRRLCAVAKGIIRGVGEHYKEQLILRETSCMHVGAVACTIEVDRKPAG